MVTQLSSDYWIAYSIFFSALIITIRTDIETMLISRFASAFLIPVGFLLTIFDLLPITFAQSCIGAISAYIFLYGIGWLYYKFTHRIGMGQGDVELIGMIGAFLGAQGWWASLMLASLVGSFSGAIILFTLSASKTEKIKLPFGPFLALGALCYVFYAGSLMKLFLGF